MGKLQILPNLKPHNKSLSTNIGYQRHKTTFGILSILILEKNIDSKINTFKMLPRKPWKIIEIFFYVVL